MTPETQNPRHVFDVPGISCEHCERAIEGTVSAVPGVVRVAVDVEGRIVVVDGGDEAAIVAAIDDAGYDVA